MKRFLLTFLILLISNSIFAQNSSVHELSRWQTEHYLEQIAESNNSDLYLWALVEVLNSPDIRTFADSLISNGGYEHEALQILQDTTLTNKSILQELSYQTASPFLFVAHLLKEQNKSSQKESLRVFLRNYNSTSSSLDFRALASAIINKEQIGTDIFSADTFHPIHFLLLYDRPTVRNNAFTEEYLQKAANSWSFSNSQNLKNILGISALFRIYYLNYDYSKTAALYEPMVGNSIFPSSNRKINILRALDYSMYTLGYYNRSINITRNYSLPLAQYLNQEGLALKLRMDLGLSLYEIGKIEESKQLYLEIKNDFKSTNSEVSKARIFNNLAVSYWKSGDFDRYLELQFQALKEAGEENNYDLRYDILTNLFTHYRINKDYNSAEEYLSRATELSQDEKNVEDLAQLSYYRGQLFRDARSDYDEALKAFDKALGLISIDNYYNSYLNILTEKALLLEKMERVSEARDIHQRVLNIAHERKDLRNSYYAAFNTINTYLAKGQADSAKSMLDTLQTNNLSELDFFQLVKARTVQARYQTAVGNPKEGAAILEPVIQQIVQRSRSSGDLETGFWQVEPEYLDAFERYANLLIETDQTEQAVEVLDQLKTINDAALYQNPLVRSKVLNEQELSKYKRLTENLDVLRRKLLAAEEGNKSSIQQEIDELSAQKSTLDKKISSNANPAPVSINKIQRQMNAHQRVLHITELNDTYYFAIISRNNVRFKKIPITDQLRSGFEASIEQMAKGSVDMMQLFNVTQLLDITDLPEAVNQLTIIPDSYLYQLPLDILPLERPANSYSYGETEYLIERYETNYMTSLNDFNKSSSSTNRTFDYAGYGISNFEDNRENRLVPLPEAKAEIQTIANQLTAFKDKRTFLNTEATEQAFRESAPGARILHLATHSEVANQDPMFSSIYLSQAGDTSQTKFPGRIFAYEFFELNLSNELVMLNSCESGSGSYLQGTGIVGLSRALRYAGAQSLVLNLWSVNDMMASDFAIKFYEGINEGLSKSEALRDAKLHFLKTKNANPHYWGSYMLLGDKQPIIKPNERLNNIVASSFMLFFLTIVVASSVVEMRRRAKS